MILKLFFAFTPLFATPQENTDYIEKKDLPTYPERNVQLRTELDETIHRQIDDYIRGSLTDPRDDVYVSVDDGVVTLKGTISTSHREIDLLDFVRQLKGVTYVDDEIKLWRPIDKNMPPINPKGPFEIEYNMMQNPPDDRVWNSSTPVEEMGLKGRIRQEIEQYEDVSFGVYYDLVILEGYVETGDDKKRIERIVKRIKGVTYVDNRIQVRNKYPKKPRYPG